MTVTDQELELQRYLDGDLSNEEADAVQARLVREPELADQLQQMRRLGQLMTAAAEYETAQLNSEQLFARISAGIEAPPLPAPAPAGTEPAGTESLFQRLLQRGFWMPAGGFLAMASALLLTLYRPIDDSALELAPSVPVVGLPAPGQPASAGAAGPAALPGHDGHQLSGPTGAEVVQVDFGDHPGTVFDIDLEGGASTQVVWIND